jgi:hypothetical protein
MGLEPGLNPQNQHPVQNRCSLATTHAITSQVRDNSLSEYMRLKLRWATGVCYLVFRMEKLGECSQGAHLTINLWS